MTGVFEPAYYYYRKIREGEKTEENYEGLKMEMTIRTVHPAFILDQLEKRYRKEKRNEKIRNILHLGKGKRYDR